MLRPGTAVFKYAQKAGLPGGNFRWLPGIPDLSTEFRYPAGIIIGTVEHFGDGEPHDGCVVSDMVAGKVVFDSGSTIDDVLTAVVSRCKLSGFMAVVCKYRDS